MYIFLFLFLSYIFEIEASEKKRFFCIDFHGSASADIKNVLEQLGHEVDVWIMPTFGYGYSHNMGVNENSIKSIDFFKWLQCDEKIYDDFYQEYKDYLEQFDGFIAAYNSSFGLLYDKFDKPIIIVNAVRYEVPFTDSPGLWAKTNDWLILGKKNKKLFIVANNKADEEYLKFYTGLDSILIPSLCEYTKGFYSGKKENFIFQPINRDYQIYSDLHLQFPNLIATNLSRPYRWQDLYDYKGIIHIPYQVSTMSLFEEYTANVPLFCPSKKFLLELREKNNQILSEASYFFLFKKTPPPTIEGDLNNLCDPNVVNFWIEHADFYNLPYIQYFDSFDHLKYLLETIDVKEVSRNMEIYNKNRKEEILKKWQVLLKEIFE